MASFVRGAAAPRVQWTPEEAGRFAAARDIALLKACSDDRRLLATALRLRFVSLVHTDGMPSVRVRGAAHHPHTSPMPITQKERRAELGAGRHEQKNHAGSRVAPRVPRQPRVKYEIPASAPASAPRRPRVHAGLPRHIWEIDEGTGGNFRLSSTWTQGSTRGILASLP